MRRVSIDHVVRRALGGGAAEAAARAFLAAVAVLFSAGCVRDAESAIEARGAAVSYVLAEQVERGPGTSVNLADLSPFRWDRMYLFGPRTPATTVRDSVHVAWPGAAHVVGAATPDSVNLLVFVGGGQVLAVAAHPRRRGDFVPARVGRGYAPAEALFVVDSTSAGGAGIRRLLR
ncbi:MAG TPA: hypothetical protein VFJ74_10655 [Gemmatimonadaceae bacterium]|nr:hypothetical protein [Gemmatimonadaceae bacterium]